jgi:hypothetical protein
MPNRAPSLDWSRMVTPAAIAAVVVTVSLALADGTIGWFVALALGGGALIALALIATQSRSRDATPSPDSFAGRAHNIIDISTLRVAGLGGLGLVILSGVVALQFERIGATLIAGAIGGTVAAVVMILHRRRHGGPRTTA